MLLQVAVLPECCRLDEIVQLLRTNEHSAFPVVQNLANMKFKGLIRRDYLCGLLKVGGTDMLQQHYTHDGDITGIHMIKMDDLMR